MEYIDIHSEFLIFDISFELKKLVPARCESSPEEYYSRVIWMAYCWERWTYRRRKEKKKTNPQLQSLLNNNQSSNVLHSVECFPKTYIILSLSFHDNYPVRKMGRNNSCLTNIWVSKTGLVQDHTDSLWLIWNWNQIFWCPVWDVIFPPSILAASYFLHGMSQVAISKK